MKCFVVSLIILFGKHYIIFDIYIVCLCVTIFSPTGRRVKIIGTVPYYFEYMMPYNLISIPLLEMAFQEKKKIRC
jgi:hypothetical protein